MTREEELQQFAEQNTKGLYLDRHNLIQMVKQGAEWADQHPQWIPVEERLPKFDEQVLVYGLSPNGCRLFYVDCLIQDINDNGYPKWDDDTIIPTHWMEIVPPRKMIVQEDVPYTKGEVKAMVKTIHDLRNHLNQLRKANNRLGWHSGIELPKTPKDGHGKIIVITFDDEYGVNNYANGWNMDNIKWWCYPPKEEE